MPENPEIYVEAPSQFLQMIIAAIFIFALICGSTIYLVPEIINLGTIQEGDVLYNDEGQGIMLVESSSQEMIKKAFAQWKNDFPQRAENMLEVKMDGCYKSYFMIIYQD